MPRPDPAARPDVATLSLKGRALKYLAAREHSRVELTRKLAPHAESPEQVSPTARRAGAKGLAVGRTLRRIHAAPQRGTLRCTARLKAELAQHQLPPEVASAAAQTLRETEFVRAHALWLRRFGAPPETPEDKARQMRFLAQSGLRLRRGADASFGVMDC
jgi:regulatory protein